jgi:transposase-like protein
MSSTEKKERRKFTPEFKAQAVKPVLAGHTVAAVARELGIADSLLRTWVTRHRLLKVVVPRGPSRRRRLPG